MPELKIEKNVPRTKAVRKDTMTFKIKALEVGDCLKNVPADKLESVRAMACRYGIKLVSARQENGETWFWRE